MTSRRIVLAAAMAGLLPLPLRAQDGTLTVERFPLWPKAPPGGDGLSVSDQWVQRSASRPDPEDIAWPHVATPMLTVVKPARPNGAAVLVCPGGGYARVAVGRQ